MSKMQQITLQILQQSILCQPDIYKATYQQQAFVHQNDTPKVKKGSVEHHPVMVPVFKKFVQE